MAGRVGLTRSTPKRRRFMPWGERAKTVLSRPGGVAGPPQGHRRPRWPEFQKGCNLEDGGAVLQQAGGGGRTEAPRCGAPRGVKRACTMHSPTTTHMVALKRIMRYLCGTIDYGLIFRPSSWLSLVGYGDANGVSILMITALRLSTAEAEYRSLVAATSDVIWLMSLLQELHFSSVDTPTVWCDNSNAVAVAANPVLHSKFKHVEMDLFFVREKVASGSIIVGEVPACDQVTDILTKPLSVTYFNRF
ncbi:hypothetical protein CXB51_014938 [Gossypium anomalum]|uniref:Uncharacterized protein n=1 Tax=Gossypium anomalum TaxID=47600 RepID=A0A8J5YKK7_9ROSI|nr:hypothetical protein CXB51_014938 [Gossypium anomalum]